MNDFIKGAGTTAISRKMPSKPLTILINKGKVEGRVLHFGAGRQENPDRTILDQTSSECVHYDPVHGPSDKSSLSKSDFDVTYAGYVLNVLPPELRRGALKSVALSISEQGTSYFAVRSDKDIQSNRKDSWQPHCDGFLVPYGSDSHRFQKGYTVESLRRELYGWFSSINTVYSNTSFCLLSAEKPHIKPYSPKRGGSLAGKKFGVGKIIGGKIYLHKNYLREQLGFDLADRAEKHAADFQWNCAMFDPKKNTLRLDEAPDFDTASEPTVGKFLEIHADGTTRESHSSNIWHHKYLWVDSDYDGFDPWLHECWSRYWFGTIQETASGSPARWKEQCKDVYVAFWGHPLTSHAA